MSSVAELLKAGSSAVREVSKAAGKDIQVAVHYTDIDKQGEVAKITADLEKYGVDYDIFAMSYYSFWHGSMENMQDMAEYVQDTYGKKVVIAETSYCYTSEDGDGAATVCPVTATLWTGMMQLYRDRQICFVIYVRQQMKLI